MKSFKRSIMAVVGAFFLAGCIVREEPPRHRVYVYDDLPPPLVEVVPVAPEPGLIWVQGVYIHEGVRWRWHHGYWRR